MKRFLEKITHTIIPHEKNSNVPHILKIESLFVIATFAIVLFYFNQNNFSIIRNLNLSATVYPAVLADLANQDRAVSGVSLLTWNNTLAEGAKLKALDMAENSYFAHTSPSGVTPWSWFAKVNYNFIYAGENLAVDFTESKNVQNAWLNSPTHRANILSSHFTEVGIATVDGVFEGKNTTFVVEFFGRPAEAKVIEKSILKTPQTLPKETNKVTTSSVAGVSAEKVPSQNTKQDLNIKTVEETDKYIVVKNENILGEEFPIISDNLKSKSLSTCFERFIVSPTQTIKYIYMIVLVLVLIAILLMLSKEYKKHHIKHVVMGVVLVIIVAVLLYTISV
ncbi:MAG: CAP domain-containing protein [Candidatus Paceibacterota bacterium]|jgi:hypothetical protein